MILMNDDFFGSGVYDHPSDVADEDRDEAYVAEHSLCSDCDGLLCLRGISCFCDNDLGKPNPEHAGEHIHDDAAKCPGLVQFPPATPKPFFVPSSPKGEAIVDIIV